MIKEILGHDGSALDNYVLGYGGTPPKYKLGEKVKLSNQELILVENGEEFVVTMITFCEPFGEWMYQAPWGIFESEKDLLSA